MASIKATVVEGYKVASGNADDSPYPDGTIKMQSPYFKKLGVNLEGLFKGTLNSSISPFVMQLVDPEFTLQKVKWANGFPPESFSFSRCKVPYNDELYQGIIYYPHPEAKIGHFHSPSLIEVILEYIPGIKYGDSVVLKYNNNEVNIIEDVVNHT